MKVLVVGAGVIGTVYGAHLAAAGNTVSVLTHGLRTGESAGPAMFQWSWPRITTTGQDA